jgi:hypothetical protein
MSAWNFYNLVTGEISSKTIIGPADIAKLNCPEGCREIKGRLDRLSQKIDIETGTVIDFIPEQPSHDHEWNAGKKRWKLNAPAQAAAVADRKARSELVSLERKADRYVAESVAGVIDDEGRRRLAEILSRKAELRKSLKHG